MAEFEKSRTAATNPRGNFTCVPAAVTATADIPFAVDAPTPATHTDNTDPVLRLWMAWQEARTRYGEPGNETGRSDTAKAESQATERHAALARELLSTPARSVAGAAAKLSCFIETNTPTVRPRAPTHPPLPGDTEPSFPALRAILTDLVMIAGVGNGHFRQ